MTGGRKYKFLSTNEMRRRAPFHYLNKAKNAKFSVQLLGAVTNNQQSEIAKEAGYGGTPGVALGETKRREAALALELVIKANIALLIENGNADESVKRVPITHDVAALWREAKLPKLEAYETKQLIFAREVLQWSGRYAAPAKDESDHRQQRDLESVDPGNYKRTGEFRVRKAVYFSVEKSMALYDIAERMFLQRHKNRTF